MLELKALHPHTIARASEKAERYRLLNQPRMAESICLDLLQVDPTNQQALVTLILSLSDQFGEDGFSVSDTRVNDLVPRLNGEYERLYYAGIISERRGLATLSQRVPGYVAYEWLRNALDLYQQAEAVSPSDNDDAILRWNTCVRIIQNNAAIQPRPDSDDFEYLE